MSNTIVGSQLDERKSDLLERLSQTESSTDRQAKKYERWARNLNIATGIAALPSILVGLIASLVHSHPDPWIFSVLATLANVRFRPFPDGTPSRLILFAPAALNEKRPDRGRARRGYPCYFLAKRC